MSVVRIGSVFRNASQIEPVTVSYYSAPFGDSTLTEL